MVSKSFILHNKEQHMEAYILQTRILLGANGYL